MHPAMRFFLVQGQAGAKLLLLHGFRTRRRSRIDVSSLARPSLWQKSVSLTMMATRCTVWCWHSPRLHRTCLSHVTANDGKPSAAVT